jgi:hypothetical protein
MSPKPALTCDCLQSGRQDLNLRPLDPQSSALPSCATSRYPSDQGIPRSNAHRNDTALGRVITNLFPRRVRLGAIDLKHGSTLDRRPPDQGSTPTDRPDDGQRTTRALRRRPRWTRFWVLSDQVLQVEDRRRLGPRPLPALEVPSWVSISSVPGQRQDVADRSLEGRPTGPKTARDQDLRRGGKEIRAVVVGHRALLSARKGRWVLHRSPGRMW